MSDAVVDDSLSDEQLNRLVDLWKSLPASDGSSEEVTDENTNAVTPPNARIPTSQSELQNDDNVELKAAEEKSSYRPSRYYFCDCEEWVQKTLEGCVDAARTILACGKKSRSKASSSGCRPPPSSVFQHIRFLNYERPGGILPPHVDLCRLDNASGFRSTHTFILYLTDCGTGGGTALLHQLKDPKVISVVQPKRGRALIFPHLCPHSGLEVVCAPKLLLRGEVYLPPFGELM